MLYIALALGAIVILTVVYVYLKTRRIGLGEIVLFILGCLLICIGKLTTFDFVLSPLNGLSFGIVAEKTQDTALIDARINGQLVSMRDQLQSHKILIDQVNERLKIPMTPQVQPLDDASSNERAINSNFSVLIFYRLDQKSKAQEYVRALLSKGFSASATATQLNEAKEKYPRNTAWIVYSERGKERVSAVKDAASALGSQQFVIKPEAAELKRGDIQVLMF